MSVSEILNKHWVSGSRRHVSSTINSTVTLKNVLKLQKMRQTPTTMHSIVAPKCSTPKNKADNHGVGSKIALLHLNVLNDPKMRQI